MSEQTSHLKSLIFIILFLLSFLSVNAQISNILDLTDDDYTKLQLPPLAVLFENAKKSSNVKFFNTRQRANESMLRTERRDWLKYFKLVASYQYGVVANNSYFTDQNAPQIYQTSNNKQSWYNVGLVVAVPFDDFFDRRNRVRRRKLEMQATEAETERWYDEQKIRIIQAYTQALNFLAVLRAKSEAMIIADTQYKVAELDFINGKISATDLSSCKSVQTDAVVNYEQAKASLNNVLLQLEVLSKTEIISQ